MEELAQLVQELDSSNGWDQFFFVNLERKVGALPSHSVGQEEQNLRKNRYIDLYAVDHSRVVLSRPVSGYINANHVKAEALGRRYVLSQGPLANTCVDFWQMVWDQNSPGIVMLNKVEELYAGEMYWPGDQVGSGMTHDNRFLVTLKNIEAERVSTLRQFELKNLETDEVRSIAHMHFKLWPDFGVPRSPEDFISFWDKVRQSGLFESKSGPCVIHCTGGVGRSGTLCFTDVVLQKFKQTGELKVSELPEILLELRKQRYWQIQTSDQLRLAYLAILSGTELISKEKAANSQ